MLRSTSLTATKQVLFASKFVLIDSWRTNHHDTDKGTDEKGIGVAIANVTSVFVENQLILNKNDNYRNVPIRFERVR